MQTRRTVIATGYLKGILPLALIFTGFSTARTQGGKPASPVQWEYTSKKIADKTYEVHLTATLKSGWHAYSQKQPADAVAQPTQIRFKPNPLVAISGKIKEIGEMEKWHDEGTGIQAYQYAGQVDFVQVVNLKGNVKTTVSGSLTYQVCNDRMCLPPATEGFTVALGD